MRYMLPVVPLLCVAAGEWCARLGRCCGRWTLPLVVLLNVPAAHAVWQHGRLLAQTDTRLLAAHWIEAEVPDGAWIAMVGSDYGYPQVRRSRSWLQVQLEDAQAAGLAGRRLAAMLMLADYPPPPSYYVIELKPDRTFARRTVWTSYELTQLRAAGVGWIVTHEHPLAYSQVDPRLQGQLEREAVVVRDFDPFREAGEQPVYDPLDAFYAPVARFEAVERPGPRIRIYRLER